MNLKIFLLSTLVLLSISSCSGTYKAYYQTLKIAFSQQDDAKMTLVEVQRSTIDVIAVKRGERPTAIMALAYLENGQHKWISNDKALIIMEKGRIVRTLGLDENLLYLSNTRLDPLKSLPLNQSPSPTPLTWSYMTDQTGDEYGYPIESKFSLAVPSTVQALGRKIEAKLYTESSEYKAPTKYLRINDSWQNLYWYAKTGELIKTIQKVSPLSESVEITYLSRIARLK